MTLGEVPILQFDKMVVLGDPNLFQLSKSNLHELQVKFSLNLRKILIYFILLCLEINKTFRRSNRKSKMHGYGVKNKIKFIVGSLAN